MEQLPTAAAEVVPTELDVRGGTADRERKALLITVTQACVVPRR